MSPRLQMLQTRINRGSLRERLLLFTMVAGVLALGWQHLVILPLQQRQARIAQSLDEISSRIAANSAGLGADGVAAEFSNLKTREIALANALSQADRDLHDAQLGMIEPKQMVGVLTEVLQKQQRLRLVLLHNLPVQPLLPALPAVGGERAPAVEAGPYVHPVEIVIRGDYLSVLDYLRELESRHWGFQWRRFEFNTDEDGPEYRIQFTTLSMQPNWLGV